MSSRSIRRTPAARAGLVRVAAALSAVGLAASAFAVQPGTYQGYTAAGMPVTVGVTLYHGHPVVQVYDYSAIVTCTLSGSQYQWEQEVIGGAHIAADGSFSMGSATWGNHTRMIGRFDDAGHLVGTAFQQDPLLTLEDPQRAEFCADGVQHFAARLTSADPVAHAGAGASAGARTTTRLDAEGRVLSLERGSGLAVRSSSQSSSQSSSLSSSPSSSMSSSSRVAVADALQGATRALPSAGAASAPVPGHYAGTNSQGHPMSFDVQVAADGVSLVLTHYQDSEDMACAVTGQPAYSSGYVTTLEPIAADGSFAFTSASLFAHYDVTGRTQPDGTIAGSTREAVSGLQNTKPQGSELCAATGTLSWLASRVAGAPVAGR